MTSSLPLSSSSNFNKVLGSCFKKKEGKFSDKQKDKIDQTFQDLPAQEDKKLVKEVHPSPVNENKLHQFILSPGERLEQHLSCSSVEEGLEIFRRTSDYSALADFISLEKISVATLMETLSDDEVIHLAPHLKYGDFRNIEYDLLHELLAQSSQLNHLLINHPEIKELPKMRALQTLNCSLCTALVSLPAGMHALQTLNCSYCSALTSLPTKMDALQTLYCYDCSSLISLPTGMVALQILHCFGCRALTTLPDDLHALQILHCFGCPVLARLPNGMTALKTLHCYGCLVLAVLPTDLHKLLILHCFSCPALIKLPTGMIALQELYCFACRALIALPEDLHRLLILNCSGCYALTSLPTKMDALQILNCSGCTTLIALPLALPSIQNFNCTDCISLSEVCLEMLKSLQKISDASSQDFFKN